MRDESDPETRVIPHNCATCTSGPDAWRVCSDCDSTLRSRRCPVCREAYAPMEMYRLLENKDVEESLWCYVPLLGRAACEGGNSILWSPASRTLRFSMPVDANVGVPLREYLQATMPPTPEMEAKLARGTFDLANHAREMLEGKASVKDQPNDRRVRQGSAATGWLYSRGGELGSEEMLLQSGDAGAKGPETLGGEFFLTDMTPEEQRKMLEEMSACVEGLWSLD